MLAEPTRWKWLQRGPGFWWVETIVRPHHGGKTEETTLHTLCHQDDETILNFISQFVRLSRKSVTRRYRHSSFGQTHITHVFLLLLATKYEVPTYLHSLLPGCFKRCRVEVLPTIEGIYNFTVN